MNTYEELENDIVTKLEPLTVAQWLQVVPMPEKQADFARPAGNQARITVSANQTETDALLDTNLSSSEANNTVAIIIQANALRGDRGVYQLEKAVRLLLVGHKPANHMTKLRYVRGRFVEPEFQEGVWTFQMDFMTKGVILQEYDEDAGAVLVSQIVHSTDLETTVTTTLEEIDGGFPDTIYDDEYDGGTP